jgi:hypothetical protein
MRAQAALPRAQKQDTDTGRSARAAAEGILVDDAVIATL